MVLCREPFWNTCSLVLRELPSAELAFSWNVLGKFKCLQHWIVTVKNWPQALHMTLKGLQDDGSDWDGSSEQAHGLSCRDSSEFNLCSSSLLAPPSHRTQSPNLPQPTGPSSQDMIYLQQIIVLTNEVIIYSLLLVISMYGERCGHRILCLNGPHRLLPKRTLLLFLCSIWVWSFSGSALIFMVVFSWECFGLWFCSFCQ